MKEDGGGEWRLKAKLNAINRANSPDLSPISARRFYVIASSVLTVQDGAGNAGSGAVAPPAPQSPAGRVARAARPEPRGDRRVERVHRVARPEPREARRVERVQRVARPEPRGARRVERVHRAWRPVRPRSHVILFSLPIFYFLYSISLSSSPFFFFSFGGVENAI